MAEKTEKPTEKKRKDSAKKGQAFKSKDLITTVILVSGVYYLTGFFFFKDFELIYTATLLRTASININDFLIELLIILFKMILPVVVLCSTVGIFTNLLQTRFSIATEAIKLNFKALNPVEGFKKLFSMRTIKELVKSLLYLAIFILTCYLLINNDLKTVLSLYQADINGLISTWLALVRRVVLLFIACAVVTVLFDIMAEYFLHSKDLKMDKHEVKREHKESDGNPEIKHARRRIHYEILSGEEMAAIRNSKVVLANPTHIAIAIYFNPDVASLPFIALRVINLKARAAIKYAEKNGIPVIRYISLTRSIYKDYKQHSFVSLYDDALMEIMNILIWLREVEIAGMGSSPLTDNIASNQGCPGQDLPHEDDENKPRD